MSGALLPQARGIPRYTMSLTETMAARRGPCDYRAALIGEVTPRNIAVDAELRPRFAENGVYRCFKVPETSDFPGAVKAALSDALITSGLRRYSPDAIHFTNWFEVDQPQPIIPAFDPPACPEVICATLYDLIPLVMADTYLADPAKDRSYRSYLERLRACDLILAISESTRRDAIGLLRIDDERVVTIGADASEVFRPVVTDLESRVDAMAYERRLGITRDFVLYCSGTNPRKNSDSLVRAYCALPAAIRETRQLVITGHLALSDREGLRRLGSAGGLREDEMVLTGYVTDEALARLYSRCEVFVFPSLYEGFGLPILEAMRCGAPVIASNNSSMAELIARADALFDPSKPGEITALMRHVVSTPDFRNDLVAYGLVRAKDFSWESCADIAWQALSEAVSRKRNDRAARSIANATGKRRRIAYVSPLPPSVSGVADYSAELIPALAQKVELVLVEDQGEVAPPLANDFPAMELARLVAARDEFDAIVYNFGNSRFHQAMWDVLPKAPGIVILHDAFLCDLINWMDEPERRPGYFCRILFEDHGMNAARSGAAPSLRRATMIMRAMSGHVLRHATAVAVHSQFAADLLAATFPWLGVRATVIPQSHRIPPWARAEDDGDADRAAANRAQMKVRLGLPPDAFVVASFGYLATTKKTEELVRAFPMMRRANDYLVLVGGCPDVRLSRVVTEMIGELGLERSVIVTGFVDSELYDNWLQAADIAVQLRQDSRGETSRTALDCLAAGLPVIVSDYASSSELPDKVVVKVPAAAAPAEIASAIESMRADARLRRELGGRARAYVSKYHSPAIATDKILAILDRAIDAPADLGGHREICKVATVVRRHGGKIGDERLRPIAESIAMGRRALLPSRLFVDVSEVVKFDYGSGIQRVVTNITRSLMNFEETPRSVIPTAFTSEGHLQWATELETPEFAATPGLANSVAMTLEPGPGDVLLLLDANWTDIDIFAPQVRNWRRRGMRIFSVVYDLLPLQLPKFFPDTVSGVHRHWLEVSARITDGLIAGSKTVADESILFLTENRFHREGDPLRIGWFHHGSDFAPRTSSIREEVTRLSADGSDPYILMVGTVDPRKNHQLVIRAIEALVSSGEKVRLVVAGKIGWEKTVAVSVKERASSAGPIIFLERPTDAELDLLYRHALALAMPSFGEGFGIPIVEAAQRDLPAIASDIPVFREFGGDGTLFVDPHNVEAFASAIKKLMDETPAMRRRRASTVLRQSWSDSARQLVDIIYGGNWYRTIQ